MSYINDALKKVQKERQSRYAPYDDIISAFPEPGSRKFGRRHFVSVAAAMLLALLAASVYFIPRLTPGPGQNTSAATPATAEVSEKAALPAATAQVSSGATAERERIAKATKLYQEALTAHREKREESAENFYRATLSLDSRHVRALNNLGALYMGKRRYEEAMELFIKALAAQEDYVDPYYNLACLYSQLANVSASLWYLERAVSIDDRAREWAKQESDFEKFRSMPAFKRITGEMEQR